MKIDRNPFHSLVLNSRLLEGKDTGTMLNEMCEMVEKTLLSTR